MQTFDVAVVGGGAAGLSAALTLSRARRSVLVVDDGRPRNAPAGHMHGYLGREGIAPGELLAVGRAEVEQYGVQLLEDRVTGLSGSRGDFVVQLSRGEPVRARRLVLATGLVDVLPDIEDIAGRWGRDVLHCPYCHGWEVRDRRIGVVASPVTPMHQAQLFRQLSDQVTLFLHGTKLTDDEADRLAARGIDVVDGTVASLQVSEDQLEAVLLADGRRMELDALVVPPRMEARTELAEAMGAAAADHPMGRMLAVDAAGATTVPGLWAVGNTADLSAQVLVAAAQGLKAATVVNADLVEEEVEAALTADGPAQR